MTRINNTLFLEKEDIHPDNTSTSISMYGFKLSPLEVAEAINIVYVEGDAFHFLKVEGRVSFAPRVQTKKS